MQNSKLCGWDIFKLLQPIVAHGLYRSMLLL